MTTPFAFIKKHGQCTCCSNPWNSDMLSSMQSCEPCLSNNSGITGIDPKNINFEIKPTDDFYMFSNGKWKDNNHIPKEYSSWNSFMQLNDINLVRLKAILDSLSTNTITASTDDTCESAKLRDFYTSFMNKDDDQFQHVLPLLQYVTSATTTNNDATSIIAKLHKDYGINILFSLRSTPDKKNSLHEIGNISQGGLGLPDRDYYFDADKEDKRIKYIEYIANLLTLLGSSSGSCYVEYCNEDMNKVIATDIFNFEKNIASSHLTKADCRNPHLTYNKMSIESLQTACTPKLTYGSYLTQGVAAKGGIDFIKYFSILGKSSSEVGDINIQNMNACIKVSSLCGHKEFKHYTVFHILNNVAPFLNQVFVDMHFNFYQKTLQGTLENKPRWKRALAHVEESLGKSMLHINFSTH